MTIVASPYATDIVFRFVNALNKHLSDTPAVEAPRAGTKRRKVRENTQRKAMKGWHKSADEFDRADSRQVKRRMKIKQQKSLMQNAKNQATRVSTLGGSASVY